MNRSVSIFVLSILFASCSFLPEVDVMFFNLSTRQITVLGVSGLPSSATPGVLVPVANDTDQLYEASINFSEYVPVGDQIKIDWQEGGISHQVEWKRVDLHLPATLKGGQIRFTYVGDEKWRVKIVPRRI